MKKEKRQQKILELIRENDIETQSDLAERLKSEGFSSTQGTISRDIRELRLTKISDDSGRQKYAPLKAEDLHVSGKYRRILTEAIVHMESADNLLVVKTVSGMAMACGAAIDAIALNGVVGCIAGDDTILCVIKNAEMVPAVMEEIQQIIGGES